MFLDLDETKMFYIFISVRFNNKPIPGKQTEENVQFFHKYNLNFILTFLVS